MNAEQQDAYDKAQIMLAFVEGKKIEVIFPAHPESIWARSENPTWNWDFYKYRIAVTKPYVNPEHVAKEYRWLATDKNGEAYLYSEKPFLKDCDWWCEYGLIHIKADNFASFIPGTCDWKDSLVDLRPESGGK